MKSVWKLLIIMMFSISSAWAAENINANMFICADPDQPAIFPGSIEEGIPKFIRYNLKYPKEAWRDNHLVHVRVDMVIDTEGKVSDIKQITSVIDDIPVHQALDTEMRRVLGKMTWYPAEKNGVAVNVEKIIHMYLCALSEYSVPFGLEYVDHDAARWLKLLYNESGKNVDIVKAEQSLRDAAELFPFNVAATVGYATLETSLGKGNIAIDILDRNLKSYQTMDPLFYPENKKDPYIENFHYIYR